jgi:hypothetical protein
MLNLILFVDLADNIAEESSQNLDRVCPGTYEAPNGSL